ncbi:SAM hydrolase/SAM-dependent halogenase family protein [Ktedonospora formicarum]|uniref:SAM-dependent chlorinase/fluorinase n=1 Tax=Ktedonospora formicarum TaxID=2778364 RepID=A0A8J3HTE7_9CHLR|nr:SAM-dependent chlorinase/fluorinase [Ktedonospora formicarum]GHO43379.1 hypothetical protein KSX_15420 [Ktedonospora formicarum]
MSIFQSSKPFITPAPVIVLMTDFGLKDGFVGVMKGVILTITPNARFIDTTHQVEPQQVAQGAWLLSSHYRYFPAGTIFLCVVDPGVGSDRRAIAVHAGDYYFVGPDNGLFSLILAELPFYQAVELTEPAYRLASVSSTFHGRDIFAPAAAHIAAGLPLEKLGPELEVSSLRRLGNLQAIREGDEVEASVIHIDHFGNIITSIPARMVPEWTSSPRAAVEFPELGVCVTERRKTFALSADASISQHPFFLEDSSGYILIAVQNGDAASALGIRRGHRVHMQL